MEYIILIVVLAVLLIGGIGSTFLLRSRSGRRGGPGQRRVGYARHDGDRARAGARGN